VSLDAFARYPLTFGPSPVHRLDRLTAQSMGRLIDLVSSGEISASSTVLYAHLGGQPALNAYAGLFK
jgi:1-aminocyclopropane-1-carboxylate deaminase/D-cysteine desulfhydrase-like pyridoxal-dependent ACC family enzyme